MKKGSFFWVGYSDLLTSLFFVMLVLFVVTIGYLKYQIHITTGVIKKIQELQAAVKELPEEYFEYQPQYKRFKLNQHIQFIRGRSEIDTNYYEYLDKVGNSIRSLINDLNQKEELKDLDIKYLVVIEGMASMDNYKFNYELSYARALSLFRFWESRNIVFDPKSCEVQISGSGTGGIREYSGDEEYRNQQFLIHIIPKIGRVIEPEIEDIIARNDEEKKEIIQVNEEKEDEIAVKESPPFNWETKYDSVGVFNDEHIAIVSLNKKFGIVNKEGKEIVPLTYDKIDRSGRRGIYIVVKNEKIGVINGFGELITQIKYDGIGEWSEGLAMVNLNNKCGYINLNGEEVIPLSYDKCEAFKNGKAKVSLEKRPFNINSRGIEIGEAQ